MKKISHMLLLITLTAPLYCLQSPISTKLSPNTYWSVLKNIDHDLSNFLTTKLQGSLIPIGRFFPEIYRISDILASRKKNHIPEDSISDLGAYRSKNMAATPPNAPLHLLIYLEASNPQEKKLWSAAAIIRHIAVPPMDVTNGYEEKLQRFILEQLNRSY